MTPSVSIRTGGLRSSSAWARVWVLAAISLGLGLSACGGLGPRSHDASEASQTGSEGAQNNQPTARAAPKGRFEEPGELDRLVDAKPLALAAVKPVSTGVSAGPAKTAPEAAGGRGRFRIQVGAESDIDAAQAKKREYERILGGSVDVVFDAPYYKLRWGFFDSKQDADDKILEISEFKIQGFVIKQ